MASKSIYDVLVIGGGPAGLSAALGPERQSHSTLLFDSGSYRNERTDYMHMVPTWDHKSPKEFRTAARKDYDRYGTVDIEDDKVVTAKKSEKGLFEVTTGNGKLYTGYKLVLATGVEDIQLDIPGYDDCWVSGIFHCLYCHGWEERGCESSGVLAMDGAAAAAAAVHFARQSLRLSKEVTVYTQGDEQLTSDLKATLESPPIPQMKIESRRITKFVKGAKGAEVILHFEDETTKTEGFIAHKPKFQLRSRDLIDQLGVEVTPAGVIKVSPPMNQTSVSSVFACGDIAHSMQTVPQALFSGNAAGVGAALQLQAQQLGQKSFF